LNGAAINKFEELGAIEALTAIKFWHILMEKNIGRAKNELGEKAAAEAEKEGRQMGFERAADYALDFDKD